MSFLTLPLTREHSVSFLFLTCLLLFVSVGETRHTFPTS